MTCKLEYLAVKNRQPCSAQIEAKLREVSIAAKRYLVGRQERESERHKILEPANAVKQKPSTSGSALNVRSNKSRSAKLQVGKGGLTPAQFRKQQGPRPKKNVPQKAKSH